MRRSQPALLRTERRLVGHLAMTHVPPNLTFLVVCMAGQEGSSQDKSTLDSSVLVLMNEDKQRYWLKNHCNISTV